ncbi:hypothetical protein I2I05_11720 [Hymenobacter sp. BT683]|uniref:Lipoprotein n=1 Tax=Hymenobacter jeongseonensis TaxID=2791027 RepID=A0ABS0II95_9BACT|nr:hypothetical protein [Hymenobacter jeongseonensis]MBF9238063.1 hypothetical protein [Hymenobacter jeongseonensis]
MKGFWLLLVLAPACSPGTPPPSVAVEVQVGLPRANTDDYLEGPGLGVRLKMTNLTNAPLVFGGSTDCAARPYPLVVEHPNGKLRLHAASRDCRPLTIPQHASRYPVLLAKGREVLDAYDFTDSSYATLIALERECRVVYVQPDGRAPGKVGSFRVHYRKQP